MAIFLIIKDESSEERVRLTSKPFILGRSSKCHKTLDDNMVSGRHLAIKINDNFRVVLKDLGTTNGTYLNGSKIDESYLYLDDFVQIGKVSLQLDDSDMSAKELGLHKRDYERTNVTFVKMGAQVEGVDDYEEDEFGHVKQKNLLAKIRQKKEQEDTGSDVLEASQEDHTRTAATTIDEHNELKEASELLKKEKKKSKKKRGSVKEASKEKEDDGLVNKLKGLFKK